MKPIFATEKFLSIIFNDPELNELCTLCLARHRVLNMLEDLAADVIEIMCKPEYYTHVIRSFVIGEVDVELLHMVFHEIRYNYSSTYWELGNQLMPYDNVLQTARFWAIFIHCLPMPQDFILK